MPTPTSQPVHSVLVADDEAHIRAVVVAKLRSAGLFVTEACDGAEALELAEASPPDMIVTDLQMPRMSGLELCQALRRAERTRHVPALLLTARGYILSEEEIALTSIREVMSKPFSARELVGRVMNILAGPERGRGGIAA